jgi:RNA polymerase sigma-70 factor (family 1)
MTEELGTCNLQTYEQVFHKYYDSLVQYANTIIRDTAESEDIVQQVFITLWEKKETINVHTSLRAMLYKSVYNASLNKIKQQKVRYKYANEYQTENSTEDSSNMIQEKELQQRIDEAIETLPTQCAKIFKMSRYEELKYKEIAESLNLSIKTIENQMGKALKLMRDNLKDYLPLLLIILTQHYCG